LNVKFVTIAQHAISRH